MRKLNAGFECVLEVIAEYLKGSIIMTTFLFLLKSSLSQHVPKKGLGNPPPTGFISWPLA
jgi:hypothetical protein